jgi:signal peptidase II
MILKYFNKELLINLILIALIFFFDRTSKAYVISLANQNLTSEIFLTSFINISLIWNDGIAFGLLSFQDDLFYDVITIFISLIIFILIVLSFRSKKLKKYSYILVTGGALGNLFDRITYGSVPDFIDLHYNEFHWFIFNIADIFITLGVICLIYDEVFLQKKEYE